MATREDGSQTIAAVSGPRPWPNTVNKDMWHLESDPDGEGKVWISNKGRVRWAPPVADDAVTFEERNYPDPQVGIDHMIVDLESVDDQK